MDDNRRDLINHLGAELAGILEDASADAALLRGIVLDDLIAAINQLDLAADRAKAMTHAMVVVCSAADAA